MGQAKKQMMEYEDNLSILDNLISLLSNDYLDDLYDNQIIRDIIDIREMIHNLDSKLISSIDFVRNLFTEEFHEIYRRLYELTESINFDTDLNDRFKSEFVRLVRILGFEIRQIKTSINNYFSSRQNIYNSEKYYHEQIKELEKQKNALETFLKHQMDSDGKSKEEIEYHKKQIKEKEIALIKANDQIKNYQKELEEKKKQENAVVEWNNKIKSAFAELTNCLSPIKNEHFRLNLMFWIYSGLMAIFLLFIVSLEVNTFCKLNASTGFPKWEDYLASIIPIPVFGGLLWAFIIQANRTQRQLVILAKHIHEIRYIEGLLLTINTLSPDINDSTKRVNVAIDRLLENHLSESSTTGIINEENIITEEKKDSVPIDIVLKLLKEVKGVVTK
ncbi:hypothetical protein [Sunxiuqinia rutila]|uniref:hypothetical protein n=1 Tax=Sunxiuqinia rutila TaxID=1397841 RepID=UPI003D36CF1B